MKEGQTLWTRDELILAINLYCKLPFGKMHKGNKEIIALSFVINRSPSAIARKLGNFASFDPTLKARGIKGLTNAGKLDEKIWNEFYNNWDDALIESENLLAKKTKTTIEKLNHINERDLLKEGLEKERLVKARINQSLFRKMMLATYNFKCCITQITNQELLIASHIVPWREDSKNRLNPMNGLLLNTLHDKAFEHGLLTITEDYEIKISSSLKTKNTSEFIQTNFIAFEGKTIHLPDKFLPNKEFLKLHNKRFKQ